MKPRNRCSRNINNNLVGIDSCYECHPLDFVLLNDLLNDPDMTASDKRKVDNMRKTLEKEGTI